MSPERSEHRLPALYDDTFRGGQQSLWGSRMTTAEMEYIAPLLDKLSLSKAVVVSGATFETAVHHLHEDPWQRLDTITGLLVDTPSAAVIRGRTLFGWERYHDDAVELFMRKLADHGIAEFIVYDPLDDPRMIEQHVKVAHALNVPINIILPYTVSPVHTEEYWVNAFTRVRELGAAGITIIDSSGLMDASEVAGFVDICAAGIAGSDLELLLDVHDQTGRALDCYRAALGTAITGFSTTARPLAYGGSVPAYGDVAALIGLPRTPEQVEAAGEMDAYLGWAAARRGFEIATSERLDPRAFEEFVEHQVPGAMMSNFTRQLADLGISEKLPAVLEEIPRVRADLGYPTMVTPSSQIVGVQAVLNVLAGTRYANIPTELEQYVAGAYGQPPGPISSVLRAKVAAAEFDPLEQLATPSLDAFADKEGPFASDEDAILALFYSRQVLRAYRAALPTAPSTWTGDPVREFVAALLALDGLDVVRVRSCHGAGA